MLILTNQIISIHLNAQTGSKVFARRILCNIETGWHAVEVDEYKNTTIITESKIQIVLKIKFAEFLEKYKGQYIDLMEEN